MLQGKHLIQIPVRKDSFDMKKGLSEYARFLLVVLLLSAIFTGCSGKTTTEIKDGSEEEQIVALSWSNVPDSVSYTSTIIALEEAGGTVEILDPVKSEDLDYNEDGKLINATDEHGFLDEKAAELVKKNSWHHSNVEEVLDGIDCVVVPGGWDISPTLYRNVQGWHGIEEDSDFSPERDVSDYILIDYCLDNDIPLLALCRGMQMLCVVSGAELTQDIGTYFKQIGAEYHDEHRDPAKKIFASHPVTVSKDSLLYEVAGKELIEKTPSWHHQAVISVEGTPLTIVGTYNTNGVNMIEAVENQKLRFCLGVQFHPEIPVAKVVNQSEDTEHYTDYDTSLSFFKAIIKAAQ